MDLRSAGENFHPHGPADPHRLRKDNRKGQLNDMR